MRTRASTAPRSPRVVGREHKVIALVALILGAAVITGGASAARKATYLWHDEFTGLAGSPPNPTNWTYDIGHGGGGWGNGELENYTSDPSNVQLDGRGHLVITALREPDGSYTSARLKTQGLYSFEYGNISARMELPAGTGLWPAFWLLGANYPQVGWPACGEIDMMEMIGQQPKIVHGTVHGPGPDYVNGFGGAYVSPTKLTGSFHVYAADWTHDYVSFSVDGYTYFTIARSQIQAPDEWALDNPMYVILNLAVGGVWPGPPNASTHFPARMLVDWVRVS
jgi:beta-glucanase (GH16 family)